MHVSSHQNIDKLQVLIKIYLTNLPMCYIDLIVSENNQNRLKIMSHHNCVHVLEPVRVKKIIIMLMDQDAKQQSTV